MLQQSQPQVPQSAQDLSCLRCKQSLSQFTWHNITLDICPQGCGVWFDPGELTAVEQSDTLAHIDQAFAGTFQPKPLKAALKGEALWQCPKDSSDMHRFEWNMGSQVVMDACPTCHGTWLDAGELEGYAATVKRFRENPPELTPELKAKLDAVQVSVNADFESALNAVTHSIVRWDVGLVDDVIRGLMKAVMRRFD